MRAALLLTLLLAAPAQAACQNDLTIFSCKIGAKTLQVCEWKGMLIYQFGPEGAPELSLTTPIQDADFTPWPGIGRTMWNELAFHNDGVTYRVWSSLEKQLEENQPEPQVEGGVSVTRGEAELASLTCTPGSVTAALDVIYDRKTAIGQCWDYEANRWQACP
jgi:hypothetical protein